MKKQHVRLIRLCAIFVFGIVLTACSAAASPTPSNTSATANTSVPTNTSVPADTSIPSDPSTPEDTSGSPLVGEWEGIDPDLGALVIEFKIDGSYEVTRVDGLTFELTYEMVDADTFLLIDPSGASEPATIDFVRSGDTLTLTQDGGTLVLNLHD